MAVWKSWPDCFCGVQGPTAEWEGGAEESTEGNEEHAGASSRYMARPEWNRSCPQSAAPLFTVPKRDDFPWRQRINERPKLESSCKYEGF